MRVAKRLEEIGKQGDMSGGGNSSVQHREVYMQHAR